MREARIERKTGETDISVIVNLDGTGKVKRSIFIMLITIKPY